MLDRSFPFAGVRPEHPILAESPLTVVVAQARFPQSTALVSDPKSVVARLGQALSDQYPSMESGHESVLIIGPDGPPRSPESSPFWRFHSADGAWHVALGPSFLSLYTTAYVRRSDFTSRFRHVYATLAGACTLPHLQRLGIRYLNRITNPETIERLKDRGRPEISGSLMTGKPGVAEVSGTTSEVHYEFSDGTQFVARYGQVPPGVEPGPETPSVDKLSWVLDMDSSSEHIPSSSSEAVEDQLKELAVKCHQFFNWAVDRSIFEPKEESCRH